MIQPLSIIAWATLIVGLAGVVIVCLVAFGRWANERADHRTAAATFERDFIPEAPDVAANDLFAESYLLAALNEVETAWQDHNQQVADYVTAPTYDVAVGS